LVALRFNSGGCLTYCHREEVVSVFVRFVHRFICIDTNVGIASFLVIKAIIRYVVVNHHNNVLHLMLFNNFSSLEISKKISDGFGYIFLIICVYERVYQKKCPSLTKDSISKFVQSCNKCKIPLD
jgi:hypothetical protein